MTGVLADRPLTGRRRIDPTVARHFRATMRNDFLTPRGTPYKWQELTASVDRTVIGGGVPTVVPVRYRWQRVDAGTGTPTGSGERREWTFARGQSFRSALLHTEVAGADVESAEADWSGTPAAAMDISYPELPRSPAVDLLLMLSWDVVTFEMLCTHLTTTPELREVGGRAELERVSGTWAELRFSDPGAVAVFRNARATAQHLGYGRVAGRPSVVYSSRCLDCVLDVRSGPVSQRGRSSYWVTLQADAETGDLLSADMTEMIVAVLSGPDGRRVPVQKRRTVQMWAGTDAPPEDPVAPAARSTPRRADPAVLAEALRLAARVAEYLTWQVESLEHLPDGMADLARMGFRSVVGTDLADTYPWLRSLQSDLRALTDGAPGAEVAVPAALPEHRRHLEGLLAFGQLAIDGANRFEALDEPGRAVTRDHLTAVGVDLAELLALLGRLERPDRPDRTTDHEPEG